MNKITNIYLFIESFNRLVDYYLEKADNETSIKQLKEFYIIPIDSQVAHSKPYFGLDEFLTGFRTFPQLMGFYFLNHIQQAGEYLLFAQYEADYLAINSKSKKVELIGYEEVEENGEITNTYLAAMNLEVFLECLLVIAELLFKRIVKITTIKDKEENRRHASICIKNAGGEQYQTFWMNICSAW